MKALADWLKTVERLAEDTYREAIDYFEGNPELRDFLMSLRDDEAWHFRVMEDASNHYSSVEVPAKITVDEDFKQKIEGVFRKLHKSMADGTLDEEEMLKAICEAEFSEWNKIFLYVASNLKQCGHKFSYDISKFQQHMKNIEDYLSRFDRYRNLLAEIRSIPTVWEQKILIVEDDDLLIDFLKALLIGEAEVEAAHDGREALEMIKKTFYDLIISDINMPFIDGTELFERIEAGYPDLAGRFIFHASPPSTEIIGFIKKRNIILLTKPSNVNLILETVRNKLSR